MDIILYRNVFIYFNDEAIANVIDKFTDILNEGGYLVTGHGELYAQKISLHPPFFKSPVLKPKIENSVIPNLQSEIEKLFLNGNYMAVIEKTKNIIKNDALNFEERKNGVKSVISHL